MTKSKGGDEKLANLSSPTELQNFVTEIITSQAGGAKMNKKTGGMELSPFIVSILTLGMRVASDPKLSKMFDKHRKLQGGSENVATEMYETLVANNPISGGKGKNVKKQNTHTKAESKVGSKTGKTNGSKKHGGFNEIAVLDTVVEGGKAKSKRGKSKKGGNQDVDMKMLDEIEKSLTGGTTKRSYKSKKRGGNADQNTENTTDVTPVTFPSEDIASIEEVSEVPDMSSIAEEVADLQPSSEMIADGVVDLSEVPPVESDQSGGYKSRRSKRSTVRKGGNKQMIDMMTIPESMNSPVKGGAKKARSKKTNRKNGGSGDDYLLD